MCVRKVEVDVACGYEMGFSVLGVKLKKLRCKLQLCAGAGVSLPACLALSSGQEAPTVSAVSLTANQFPGGGAVVVYECVSDECLDMWGGNRCMEEGSGEENRKRKQPPGCSGNLYSAGFGTTQQEELLSQHCYGCFCLLCCARLLRLLPVSL